MMIEKNKPCSLLFSYVTSVQFLAMLALNIFYAHKAKLYKLSFLIKANRVIFPRTSNISLAIKDNNDNNTHYVAKLLLYDTLIAR